MDISLQELQRWCDLHQEEHIALLKELAAIPAPSHQEEQRATFIRDWLLAQGANEVLVDQANNVLLPFGCDCEQPITIYAAHTDVVFPNTTPLPIREVDGKLIGPGVGDDTANVVALMLCAKYLLSHSLTPKEPVLFVFDSGEEGLGNLMGIRQVMADNSGRIKEFVSFDLTWNTIVTRAVGSERWQVRAITQGGHSYNAFGVPNAIAHLAQLITRLYQQPLPHQPDQKTTYNVGTIQGGTSINTIAAQAEMTYEYRSDDRECLAQMRQQFHTLVENSNTSQVHFEVELLGERPCGGEVHPQALEQLLTRCRQAVKLVTGTTPAPCSLSTDANLPLSLGVPATTIGLYQGAGEHTREEYVLLDSLSPGLAIALSLLLPSFDGPT